MQTEIETAERSTIADSNCPPWRAHDHFVQFYEDEAFLINSVSQFIAAGFEAREKVVVIATEAHREAFASQLLKQGVSVLEAARRSSYVALDADQALSEFMVDGQPNWGLFSDFIGGILRQATLDGAGARAFGEMVALLATRGNADAALRLEAFWNDLAKHHRFSLLCAYPMSAFRGQAQTETFLHICQEHSCSVPAESFSLAAPLEERLESISLLQQKAGSFAIERAERLQAESESRAEKAKVDLAVAAADLGIWEMDMDTKAVHCSHRCKGHFGIAGEAAVTFARLFELIHPEDRPRVQMELETAETKGSEFSVEYRVVEPSGTQRWLSTRGSSFRNGANRMVGVTQDITERKRATELLERTVAERTLRLKETIDELEAFSYSVSHDMRAPLRAINAYAHVLLTDYGQKLDLEAVACLERIERGATRLDMLVRDVLAYSKVAKGQIELRGIALRPLLEDIIHQQPEFEARKECIAMEDSLPIVRGHEACLTQCITNLIHNAFKFVAPGATPSIRIWAERLPDEARVWVSDKGIGIAPEHYDRIFQIFGRVYSEQQYPGTGIGLAIVKKAVTRMGGTCGFQSVPNHGSDFWFSLPLHEK